MMMVITAIIKIFVSVQTFMTALVPDRSMHVRQDQCRCSVECGSTCSDGDLDMAVHLRVQDNIGNQCALLRSSSKVEYHHRSRIRDQAVRHPRPQN